MQPDLVVNYITNQEFAQFNPETDMSGYSAATISGMIARASGYVDNFLGYTLPLEEIIGEVSETMVDTSGSLVVYTSKFPVQSVQSLNITLGTINVPLKLTDGNGNNIYNIPFRGKSFIFPYSQLAFMGSLPLRSFYDLRTLNTYVTANYTAGYATIPNVLKDATNLIAKDIFMRQANPQNLSLLVQGGIRMGFKDVIRDDGKSLAIQQAENILNSFRRVT